MSLHHALRAAGSAGPTSDPYFANTSLLLLGNGVNGGQNNTFVDSSSNNLTITRYGNATQGTFSPFGYNWSNYFDGSGDYLTGPSSSSLSPGTGDFTVECWINFASLPALGNHSGIFENQALTASAGSDKFYLSLHAPGSPSPAGTYWIMVGRHATSNYAYAVWTPEVGKWYHIAAVRQSGTILLFVNGTQQTVTGSTSLGGVSFGQNGFTVGAITTPFYGNSYISNLRYVVGSAVYTGNFTPSITNLTSISGTQVLTCQSNRFLDNSSNAFSITPYGDAKVTNFAPFAPVDEYSSTTNLGSAYFAGNASGDLLSLSPSSPLNFGTGDFTIELWMYQIGTGGLLIGNHYPGSAIDWVLYTGPNGLFFQIWVYGGDSITTSIVPQKNCWTHVACVRSSGVVTIYINGVNAGSKWNGYNISDSINTTIGNTLNPIQDEFIGYISNLRIVKSALYTSNFTPPSSPVGVISNTSLLLNFTNAKIIDSTGKNDLVTVGDAQISTSTKKFGTGSIKFDGNGDYLPVLANNTFAFGTGDFTIEFWFYITSGAGTYNNFGRANLFTSPQGTANSVGMALQGTTMGSTGYNAGVGSTAISYTSAIPQGQWHHFAMSRSAGTVKTFLNGSVATTNSSTDFVANNFVTIGGFLATNSYYNDYFNGFIDDFRVTVGVGRYTAAFTPPSRQFPAR